MAFGDPSVAETVRVTGVPARLDDDDVVGARVSGRGSHGTSGVRRAVGVPVFVDGALWGAVSAGSAEAIGPGLPEALERFAELVSVALAHSQAQARLRFRARLEETLRESRSQAHRASSGSGISRRSSPTASPVCSTRRRLRWCDSPTVG